MKYDPEIHHRRSIRLQGYDYSQAGAYFVTMVTQGRASLFGHIENGEMVLNDAGRMIVKWWNELPNKFPQITLGAFVVMPNHFHGIVIIGGIVGGDLRVSPQPANADGETVGGNCVFPLVTRAQPIRADTQVRPNQFRPNNDPTRRYRK